MLESGGKKRPYKDLLVTDEDGGVFILDVDCSAAQEVQWDSVVTERLPHSDRNGNPFLIERAVFLPAGKQNI